MLTHSARSPSLLSRAARGVAAGAVGTAAMDALWYRRYRQDAGRESFPSWELSLSTRSYDDAGAPAQTARKLASLAHITLPEESAGLANTLVHWATGLGWGVAYATLAAGRRGAPLVQGPLLGLCAWLTSYAVLPLLGVYNPIWKYDAATLAKDLSAHLLFGTGAALALRLIDRTRARRASTWRWS
ncbi:hypothetical protein FGE12_12685 [Aggregicoccus sp. 17bor-14]|uniref:hypothetical protein n=1 Tax=Myxococcaceae TaxID=31 RepID=UPI00129C4535|nr:MULTISPECIES: hypothetical protein [Myxococcaceae]MBF5043248.1 hypothetical protein [Simulacricoccus sp. 17bor-14]MRI89005.1 hypothetical protein [Aggregicoccus sp. 17bor-14]